MKRYLIPNWPAPENIISFTTLRHGGHSQGAYDSFNLAHHVNDHPQHVMQNRLLLTEDWQLPENLVWLNQTHSIRVCNLDNAEPMLNADAAISRQAQTPCIVLTADCLPILLCNQDGTEVAAVHAGWRGLRDGIISNAINKMKSRPEDLIAWLGPALSPDGFEVSKEIKFQFLMINPQFYRAFQTNKKRVLANLQALASIQLQELGTTAIYESEHYTDLEPSRYYSYRENKITGRMATLIAINNSAS